MTLTPAQAGRVRRIVIDRCPDQVKLPFALWPRVALQRLTRREYGIAMPIRTVHEYIEHCNFTPQRPLKQAYERDSEAVRRWVEKECPAIEKRAKRVM